MKVLIAGGTGFLGRSLTKSLLADRHDVFVLTRRTPKHPNQFQWDGATAVGWGYLVNEVDAVVHLTGFGLEHWPWTKHRKQKFIDSRVIPGRALVAAIQSASRRPRVFVQASGINYYGLHGPGIADETTPPADDFLAQIPVKSESATQPVEELSVRHVITRNAVVLARNGGLLRLLALPTRLFFGGKFGDGKQAMPWIHTTDHTNAVRFLLENENASGPYNLIAPVPVSNAEFMRTMAKTLHRPYWFHVPEFLLRIVLGEMRFLLTKGRYAQPKRLIELGFVFRFSNLDDAMEDLLSRK
ncbi:MAG TPA: TIGR01777 family oxidoreductase [Anaerolineales bacterium]|nr:TIGR01777 family oxidoreductase [Anaerolineales bacterium]